MAVALEDGAYSMITGFHHDQRFSVDDPPAVELLHTVRESGLLERDDVTVALCALTTDDVELVTVISETMPDVSDFGVITPWGEFLLRLPIGWALLRYCNPELIGWISEVHPASGHESLPRWYPWRMSAITMDARDLTEQEAYQMRVSWLRVFPRGGVIFDACSKSFRFKERIA